MLYCLIISNELGKVAKYNHLWASAREKISLVLKLYMGPLLEVKTFSRVSKEFPSPVWSKNKGGGAGTSHGSATAVHVPASKSSCIQM